jgi:hypothetical protein
VTSGKINPEKEMLQFERTGYMSVDSGLAFRYWGYRLQGWADSAAEKFGVNSPQYKYAEAQSSGWQRRIEKSSKQMFAICEHLARRQDYFERVGCSLDAEAKNDAAKLADSRGGVRQGPASG